MFYLCFCHACLRFKLVQIAEHMQQRGHTFRWVAEFGVIPVHRDTELFAYGGCGPVVSASHLTPDPLDRLDCTHQGKLRNTQVQHRTYIGYGLSTRVITSAVGRLRNTHVHVSRVDHRQL
jgi:hypothetical protein